MGDELENKKTFQSGNLTGNILTGFQAIAEVVGGAFAIGGSNAGTAVVGVGTGGLALPVILPANAAITVAAGGMITHGGFVWYNTIQNGRDTIQKFQSSSATNGTGKVKKEKPKQVHHYATNKSKTYTHQLENVTKKYGLDLDDSWNKELLPHQGRHPNAYHEYVLDRINEYDAIARGNKEIFLELFEGLKEEVRDNPDMLYKEYWLKKK